MITLTSRIHAFRSISFLSLTLLLLFISCGTDRLNNRTPSGNESANASIEKDEGTEPESGFDLADNAPTGCSYFLAETHLITQPLNVVDGFESKVFMCSGGLNPYPLPQTAHSSANACVSAVKDLLEKCDSSYVKSGESHLQKRPQIPASVAYYRNNKLEHSEDILTDSNVVPKCQIQIKSCPNKPELSNKTIIESNIIFATTSGNALSSFNQCKSRSHYYRKICGSKELFFDFEYNATARLSQGCPGFATGTGSQYKSGEGGCQFKDALVLGPVSFQPGKKFKSRFPGNFNTVQEIITRPEFATASSKAIKPPLFKGPVSATVHEALTHNGDRYVGTHSASEAAEFCARSTHGGYEDWRLPTVAEMRFLHAEPYPVRPVKVQTWTSDVATLAFSCGYKSIPVGRRNVLADTTYKDELKFGAFSGPECNPNPIADAVRCRNYPVICYAESLAKEVFANELHNKTLCVRKPNGRAPTKGFLTYAILPENEERNAGYYFADEKDSIHAPGPVFSQPIGSRKNYILEVSNVGGAPAQVKGILAAYINATTKVEFIDSDVTYRVVGAGKTVRIPISISVNSSLHPRLNNVYSEKLFLQIQTDANIAEARTLEISIRTTPPAVALPSNAQLPDYKISLLGGEELYDGMIIRKPKLMKDQEQNIDFVLSRTNIGKPVYSLKQLRLQDPSPSELFLQLRALKTYFTPNAPADFRLSAYLRDTKYENVAVQYLFLTNHRDPKKRAMTVTLQFGEPSKSTPSGSTLSEAQIAEIRRLDVNLSGCVTASDAAMIINHINRTNLNIPSTAEEIERLDVNRNGIVSAADANIITNYLNSEKPKCLN